MPYWQVMSVCCKSVAVVDTREDNLSMASWYFVRFAMNSIVHEVFSGAIGGASSQ